MNSANFHEYLRNPSMLHQINYQELKSLVLQYPYSTNLRYLMLVKSLLDGNREYDRNLVLASLGSIDRKKLRELVKQYSNLSQTSGNYEMAGEFLELKDLSTLEEVLETGVAELPKAIAMDAPMSGIGLDFLDDFGDETLEEVNPDIDVEIDMDSGTPDELEDLIENAPSTGSKDNFDELFEMDKPLTNRIRETDIEDLEIEEPLEGLFPESLEIQGLVIEEELPDLGMLEEVVEDEVAEPEGAEESAQMTNIELPDEIEAIPGEGSLDATVETEMTADIENVEIDLLEDLGADTSFEVDDAKETVIAEEQVSSIEELLTPASIPLEITNEEEPSPNYELTNEPKPLSKNAFNSYKQQFQRTKFGILTGGFHVLQKEEVISAPEPIEQLSEEDVYEEPQDVAKEVAARSLTEDNSIATETLAGILERQGHFDKAIKMYEKLSLQFPEKSSTFAAKIEKLKRK